MRALTSGTSLHFESEVVLPDASTQYASGVSEGHKYAFNVRTLPQASAENDGSWFFGNARYLRQSTTGYDSSVVAPSAMATLAEAIHAMPATEASLFDAKPGQENIGGVVCQPRQVNLSQHSNLFTRYRAISICVDEPNVRILKLEAELQTGERLTATFSDYGLPVQLPQVKSFDWSQEYPQR